MRGVGDMLDVKLQLTRYFRFNWCHVGSNVTKFKCVLAPIPQIYLVTRSVHYKLFHRSRTVKIQIKDTINSNMMGLMPNLLLGCQSKLAVKCK